MTTIAKNGWRLVHSDGRGVAKKAPITDFRGEATIALGGEPPRHEASTGRVHTPEGEFYPSVYNLRWERRAAK